VGGGVLRHPVEAADDVGQAARPERREDTHGVERRAGRDADHTLAGVVGAVVAADDVDVGPDHDAGVDDGHRRLLGRAGHAGQRGGADPHDPGGNAADSGGAGGGDGGGGGRSGAAVQQVHG